LQLLAKSDFELRLIQTPQRDTCVLALCQIACSTELLTDLLQLVTLQEPPQQKIYYGAESPRYRGYNPVANPLRQSSTNINIHRLESMSCLNSDGL